MDMNAAIALNHFGLGTRLGDTAPTNPQAWLRRQVTMPDPAPLQGQMSVQDCLALVVQEGELKRADPHAKNIIRQHVRVEIQALLGNAVTTQAPFRERLVLFWANHFTVAARDKVSAACAGAYVREAIRPHVNGRFSDMLLAVMRHPAMLTYLNQAGSIGPDTLVAEKRHRGLNENLARECLELHTVSPAAGYTQQDVTNFAKILTGWSVQLRDEPRGFLFRARTHEPGEIEVMGHTWPAGEAGGQALLAWLGTHPSTYRHIAEKLVRHFVADDPPPADVQRIAAVLQDTQGDLGAASLALIDLPGAWRPGTKLRTPQDYVVACLRATGTSPDQAGDLMETVASLGQGMFKAPFPIGWPDRAADWAGSEAMLQRVDYAYGLSGKVPTLDPAEVGIATLGPLLATDTLSHIKGAGSRRDGMTLLLASADFLRR